MPSSWSQNIDNCKAVGNISSCFFFSFADEVKRGPWDHLVPMFTNCQIKEATQVGHHVNQRDGRSLNVYNVLLVFLLFTNTYINMSIKKGHHFSWLRSKEFLSRWLQWFIVFQTLHKFLLCNPDFWNSDSTSWVQENYICFINSLWTIFWGIYEAQKLSTLLLVDTSANMGFVVIVNNIF